MDRSFEAENDRERIRPQVLIARLSDDDLLTPMPAGWTVSSVLAHLGFWDARAINLMERYRSGIEPSVADHEPEDIDWVNDAGKPLCLALPPRDAAGLALRLAEEADAAVAAMSDGLVAKLIAIVPPFNLSRGSHRGEHLDEIETALAGRGVRNPSP